MTIKEFIKNWWNGLKYEPNDPRLLAGSDIKIVVIGGGTGLSNLLRGLKVYSKNITAIVTVADDGASSGELRKEFDILPPGDIRKCISALAYDEKLISKIFEYRFLDGKKLSGHTLGNIWLTALSKHYGSFEKAIEATSEVFKTAGRVYPSTLDNIHLDILYTDGTMVRGESNLDHLIKQPEKITLSKKNVRAYKKSIKAIKEADMIAAGPGSLYSSIIPNLLIRGIREGIKSNKTAIKIYIANCSTERTQTENYSVDDHIGALIKHSGKNLFKYCLVNKKVLKKSKDESKLGAVHNITTDSNEILGCKIIKSDVIDSKNPLYHNPKKLAKSLITLYNQTKS